MRIIFGDIHGCFDEFRMLLDKIGPSDDDQIYAIGDIVDRGPKSPQLINFFIKTKNAFSVLGNHERKHLRVSLGLMQTRNFGINQKITVKQFEWMESVLHLTYNNAIEYFKLLPLYFEFEEAIIVHAGLIHGIPLYEQNEKILTGAGFRPENERSQSGLFKWCDSYPKDAKPIIFGHLGIGKAPWHLPQRENLFPIDTGCVAGGYLTAITLPGFRVYQVKSLQK